jgi:hypothetical protein
MRVRLAILNNGQGVWRIEESGQVSVKVGKLVFGGFTDLAETILLVDADDPTELVVVEAALGYLADVLKRELLDTGEWRKFFEDFSAFYTDYSNLLHGLFDLGLFDLGGLSSLGGLGCGVSLDAARLDDLREGFDCCGEGCDFFF